MIILVPEEGKLDERQWLHAATVNPAYEFLKEPAEDVYSPNDGKSFDDQG